MSKNKTRITYPCGYVVEKPTNIAIYDLRHKGKRPILIEIFGNFSFRHYRQFDRAVDPIRGEVIVKDQRRNT